MKEQGLSPQKLNELVGKRLKRNVGEEEYFYESDIVENKLKIKNYKFSRPWEVPVRYHDLIKIFIICLDQTYGNFICLIRT